MSINSVSVSNLEEDIVSADVKHELIAKYESIVYDYLAIMNSSDTIKAIECSKFIVEVGLSTITHIYKLAFCITKNVSTSADHCQKGIYCFIEYVEQTYKLGGYTNQTPMPFDFMDAIVFIYDKTISELRNMNSLDEQSGSSSAFANILSVSQTHQIHGSNFLQCRSALERFSRVAAILIWINHPTFTVLDQMDIINTHLIDFIEYAVDNMSTNSVDCDIFLFIESIQENISGMDKKEYMECLAAIKKQIKKQKKGIEHMAILQACLYLKSISSVGISLREICENEKWKRGADDLAKLIYTREI